MNWEHEINKLTSICEHAGLDSDEVRTLVGRVITKTRKDDVAAALALARGLRNRDEFIEGGEDKARNAAMAMGAELVALELQGLGVATTPKDVLMSRINDALLELHDLRLEAEHNRHWERRDAIDLAIAALKI